jgi:hypothetical protein
MGFLYLLLLDKNCHLSQLKRQYHLHVINKSNRNSQMTQSHLILEDI